MATCAAHGPKPVTLELGGKSPQLVFDDAPDVAKLADLGRRAVEANLRLKSVLIDFGATP